MSLIVDWSHRNQTQSQTPEQILKDLVIQLRNIAIILPFLSVPDILGESHVSEGSWVGLSSGLVVLLFLLDGPSDSSLVLFRLLLLLIILESLEGTMRRPTKMEKVV